MDKKQFTEALTKALEEKGKRKFSQSVELIINARNIDFSKTENRVNLDIPLPKGKGGKELKVAVIAEEMVATAAKKAGADLSILPTEIESYKDPKKLKDLAENYVLIAQPNQMGAVAKSLGQYLGKKGKLPRPLVGTPGPLIDTVRRSVRVVTRGKYLPVLQAFVGTEKMETDDLAENTETVYEAVKNKIGGEGNIKSVYVKLTMGKPVKVG
ncbi:MAG: 50S ribosomal protein L1 [Candidatus Micrarchaeota archaeon]